ncbi:MAG: transglutaminase-like cysteine peptidase [Rhodocyclaceae bacterium]
MLALTLMCGVWASNLERMQQYVNGRFGAGGVRNLLDWRDALARMTTLPEPERLKRVNEFFNRRIQFEDDVVVWSNVDYWASPLETLGRGAGDCEDFAIAKYFSLIELGVPASKMRLTYVRARIGAAGSSVTQAHMVLSYYAQPDAEPLVLDNLITEILPAGRRPDLTPVFSFNGEGVWMAGADRPASPVDRLTRWTDVLIRMKAAGYEP